MADAPAAPHKDAAPAKKAPILVIALVGLNLSALAAVGAYLFLMGGDDEPAAHSASADDEEEDLDEEEDEEEEGEDEERPLGPMVEFESLVVNLATSGEGHYLKTTFQLEIRSEEQLEHVETHMAPYRDRVLSYFGSLAVEQVTGPENVAAVREQLMTIAREVFGRRTIRAIYFTELLVQ